MTRINCGVKPSELTNKHLLAEHREIIRIPNCIAKGRFSMKGQPKEFTLNKGHVKHFYDKCLYLKNRYHELYEECIKRNFKVQYYGNSFDNVPIQYMNDYTPTNRDRQIILERINERLTGK